MTDVNRRSYREHVFPGAGLLMVGLLLGAALAAACRVSLPFEDAYITFRCARNLAEIGEYTYNPGEGHFAGSSHLYTVLCSVAFAFGRTVAPWLIAVGNSAAAVLAGYLLAAWFVRDKALRAWVWVVLTLSPPMVEVAYSGMETALFVLLLAAGGLRVVQNTGSRNWTLVAMFLLPLVRPEALAFGGIVWVASSVRRGRIDWAGGGALALGAGATAVWNLIVFGSLMFASVEAKITSYDVFQSFGANLYKVFLTNSVFAPFNARFLAPLKPWMGALVLALVGWGLWKQRSARVPWGMAIALAVLPAAAYAFGGVRFEWYFAPEKIVALAAATSAAGLWLSPALSSSRPRLLAAIAVLLLSGMGLCGQVLIGSVNGSLEAQSRVAAAHWIRENTDPESTLVLEPAGYIPFFAERRTWDEVGLGSRRVLEARRAHGDAWLVPFLRDRRPDLVVQRDAFARERVTFHGYALTGEERAWFDTHYELVHEVHVDLGASQGPFAWLVRRAKEGRVPGLFVYAWRPGEELP